MRLVLGDHDLVLGPGEVAEFDTQVPHWFGSTGKEPAEVLSLFGPQGDGSTRERSRSPTATGDADRPQPAHAPHPVAYLPPLRPPGYVLRTLSIGRPLAISSTSLSR